MLRTRARRLSQRFSGLGNMDSSKQNFEGDGRLILFRWVFVSFVLKKYFLPSFLSRILREIMVFPKALAVHINKLAMC